MPNCLSGGDREGSSDSQECGEHRTTYYTIQKQIGSMITSLLGAERGSIARKLKPDKPRVKRVDHCPFDLGESTSQRVVIMCLYERDESGWFENFRDNTDASSVTEDCTITTFANVHAENFRIWIRDVRR
jgi:hypothetical protein